MNQIDTIIFDLGGVLIDWNPEYVFLDAFNGDRKKMEWFFENICTHDWNENQDAGYPIAQATQDLVDKFPEHENYIRMFYGDWENMLGGDIKGTVAILDSLIKSKNYKVVALTNWSNETFPIAKKRFEFLHWFEGIVVSGDIKGTVTILDALIKSKKYKVVALTNWSNETFPIAKKRFEFLHWFEGIVVSGDEKTRKPFKDIYEITLKRFNMTPENSIFIDDNLRNIEAAEALGIHGIHFKNPEELIQQLKTYNIQIS